MKSFVFGLATSNELRGGVTKKNTKRWDNVRYGGGWVKKPKKCPNFNNRGGVSIFQKCLNEKQPADTIQNKKNKLIFFLVFSHAHITVLYLPKDIYSHFEIFTAAELNIEHNIKQNIEQNIESNIGPNIGSNIQPNIKCNIEHGIGRNIEPNIGPNIGPYIGPNIGPNNGSNI